MKSFNLALVVVLFPVLIPLVLGSHPGQFPHPYFSKTPDFPFLPLDQAKRLSKSTLIDFPTDFKPVDSEINSVNFEDDEPRKTGTKKIKGLDLEPQDSVKFHHEKTTKARKLKDFDTLYKLPQDGEFSFTFDSSLPITGPGKSVFKCRVGKQDITLNPDCFALIGIMKAGFEVYDSNLISRTISGKMVSTEDGKFRMRMSISGELKDDEPETRAEIVRAFSRANDAPDNEEEVSRLVEKWCDCTEILKTVGASAVKETCFKLHAIKSEFRYFLDDPDICSLD